MKLKSNFRLLGILSFLAVTTLLTSCKKDEPTPTFNDQGNIGTEGGIVKTSDGASVEIPAGALSADQLISITNITDNYFEINDGCRIYELKPDGRTFKDSVIISLPFDDEYIDLNSKEKNYGISVAAFTGSSLVKLKSEIDLVNKIAKVKTTHFSDYIIFFRSQWAEYYKNKKNGPRKILLVPYYEQIGDWCFYYSLSMITKISGYSYKAPYFASLFLETDPSVTGFITLAGLDEPKLLFLLTQGISYNYKIFWENVDNFYGYLLSCLDNDKPVLVLSIKQHHAIVVTGHNQTGFFVNDPNTPPLMTLYSYQNFKEFWIGLDANDYCNSLIITTNGNESKLPYAMNFEKHDFEIKDNHNDINIGSLYFNGTYNPNGYSLVNDLTSIPEWFDGSDYIWVKPHLSNSDSLVKICKLHVRIDNDDIVGSPQTVPLPAKRAEFDVYEPMISQLSNISKGEHVISVELRSDDSQILYDSWSFDLNIAKEYYTEGTVTDIDGKVYNTVTIGIQVWLKENLQTTRLNDGTVIPEITSQSDWNGVGAPAYCYHSNNIANKEIYGALYNWYAVNTGKLCPTGWHVPSYVEWESLVTYLGGQDIAGGKLKETGTEHWLSPNGGATNESGFTALGGGERVINGFVTLSSSGSWFTATPADMDLARMWGLSYQHDNAATANINKFAGLSIRCVKD